MLAGSISIISGKVNANETVSLSYQVKLMLMQIVSLPYGNVDTNTAKGISDISGIYNFYWFRKYIYNGKNRYSKIECNIRVDIFGDTTMSEI